MSMLRSRRSLLAGLVLAAGLTIGTHASTVAAQSVPLFPAGVLAVPVVGVAGVVVPPIIVVPPLDIGTQHAHVSKDQSRSRERGSITIGGE
jgi:hypothetical protein